MSIQDKMKQNIIDLPEDYSRVIFIGCATVIEESKVFFPATMSYRTLDFGLHVRPDELKSTLQREISDIPENIQFIILGYGLCSQAVVGLKSERCNIVIPRVDDCIGIFSGSQENYRRLHREEPGTYYLTKGWLKTGGTVFDEFEQMKRKYGEDRARRVLRVMLKNYKRLCFIKTGEEDLEHYIRRARDIAERFNLRFETLSGSVTLIKKMVTGPWDDDFVIVKPGETVLFSHFVRQECLG